MNSERASIYIKTTLAMERAVVLLMTSIDPKDITLGFRFVDAAGQAFRVKEQPRAEIWNEPSGEVWVTCFAESPPTIGTVVPAIGLVKGWRYANEDT